MATAPLNDILLPVEIINRELDGKLLLGLFAAEAGFNVHIGPINRIPEGNFGPSIYMAKSVRFAKKVKLMAQLGHKIAAWDEEGLVRFRDEIHNSRIEAEAFHVPQTLFSWGPSNSAMWRQHPFYNGIEIVDSGNPRIDLLRPELRSLHQPTAEQLREQYGPFVLINTNFGFINHFNSGGRKRKVADGSYDSQSYVSFKHQVDEHKRKIFQAFIEAVPKIATSIAPRHLVIRPHPSENKTVWEQVTADLENVSVVYEGGVAQWLLAADCLIHNGCTSAVEAYVLNRPVLAYRPVVDPALDLHLPNALSDNFFDIDSMCSRLVEILSHGNSVTEDSDRAALVRENIAALDGPFACERIVEALARLRETTHDHGPSLSRVFARSSVLARKFSRKLVHRNRSYQRHKVDHSQFTVERIGARADEISKALRRFHGLVFEQRTPGIVTIRNERAAGLVNQPGKANLDVR